ncbi:MAG: hypothetical protein A07HR67_00929 [uncultured archaeon A07HR67]|nr:MAG: hypothetical protein A07HR67_00929 [uncultured archaeon A07HR67]
MEQPVRIGIDSNVQPILLRIKLNHGLTDRKVILIGIISRL